MRGENQRPKNEIEAIEKNMMQNAAIVAVGELRERFRQRLFREVEKRYRRGESGSIASIVRSVVLAFMPFLSQAVMDAYVATWVMAIERLLRIAGRRFPEIKSHQNQDFSMEMTYLLPHDIEGYNAPEKSVLKFDGVEQSIKALFEKNVVLKSDFEKFTAEAKRNAFSIAKLSSERQIEKVREVVAECVAGDRSLAFFRAKMDEVDQTGNLSENHVETIFRTEVMKAYADSQEMAMKNPLIGAVFPYAHFSAIHDSRTRHEPIEQYGLSGTNIFRSDDPFWEWGTPPVDYGCRCNKSFMTKEQAARKGVEEAIIWVRTGIPPAKPEWRGHLMEHLRPKTGFVR